MNLNLISRRLLLKRTVALGLLGALEHLFPFYFWANPANAGSQAPLSGRSSI